MKRVPLIVLSLLVAAGIVAGVAYNRSRPPAVVERPVPPATTPAAATTPATSVAASRPRRPAGPATQIVDLVRARNPKYPATRPLDEAIDLKYAARIPLDEPVYLDGHGNLWITRPDAPAPFAFASAPERKYTTATHFIRDTVTFVLWAPNAENVWLPHLVVRRPAGDGYDLVDHDHGRRHLPDPHGLQWHRAIVLYGPRGKKDRVVVPTATGACAFTFDQSPDQILQGHRKLVEDDDRDRAVQLVMDLRGVIAWVTDASGARGRKGAARYAPVPQSDEFAWHRLNDDRVGWPDNIVHAIPLLDGSALLILSDPAEPDRVSFASYTIEASNVDEKAVYRLIDELGATDAEKRERAFKELTKYGPGITPLLERSLDDQTPEAQIRIKRLLRNKTVPSLGTMSLVDGKMRLISRFPDGGVLFYAEAGVALPRVDEAPQYVTPAYLTVRPGRAVELLPASAVADFQPDRQRITAWQNELIVSDPITGPKRFVGNYLQPLLAPAHRRFNKFVGIDSTGRWLFRDPESTARAATRPTSIPDMIRTVNVTKEVYVAPTTQPELNSATRYAPPLASSLIIDPRLPDTTPRLPGWELPPSARPTGWDKNHWPVIYIDAQPKPAPAALQETGWRFIDEKKERVYTDPASLPPPPSTKPATTPTARPATTTVPSTTQTAPDDDAERPILVTPDGTRYYDGLQSLRVVQPDGTSTTWPLPESAVGSSAKPILLRTKEGLLFLFNAPARVVRIRPTPDDDQPFDVEAVFTRKLPADPNPRRVWFDPADRICISHDGDRITVLFPIGRIPPAISQLMPPDDALDDAP